MRIIRDIWVCQDCVQAAVNGDLSGLDYAYDEKEAARREQEICAGLEALPGLVSDFGGEDQRECRECGYIHIAAQFKEVREYTDEHGEFYEEVFYECPECHSFDTRERDRGEDEFSRSECDCCGDHLAGSRYRMAQLLPEETT